LSKKSVRIKMSNYTVGSIRQKHHRHFNEDTVLTNYDSGCIITISTPSPVTITLPPAFLSGCVTYTIIRTGLNDGSLTIITDGTDTITVNDLDNGLLQNRTMLLSGSGDEYNGSNISLFCDGSQWIGSCISKGWN